MKTELFARLLDAMKQSPQVPYGTWFLIIALLGVIVWLIHELRKPAVKLDKKQKIALLFSFVALVPVNYLGIKANIYALDMTGFFSTPYFFFGLLQVVLIVFVLGYTGLIAGFVMGLVTGIAQLILHKQDPGMIVVYSAIPVILAYLLHSPKVKRTSWRGTRGWAFVILCWIILAPIILLIMGTRALFMRMTFDWAVIRYCVFAWLSLLPAFGIAGLYYWLCQKFFVQYWQLPTFVKQADSREELNTVIEQIRRLSNGTYDHELLGRPGHPRERQLYQALETLRKNLLFKHETQARLLSLDPSHYSKEGYDLILSSVLKASLTRDASSARLLLLEPGFDGEPANIRSRFGQGENTRLYAYLDGAILDKMGDREQLILTDIKVDQYFGLSGGTPFPQSIIALPLSDKGHTHGVLWVAFEQKKWFAPDDIKFYQELAYRASVAMTTKQETQQLQNDKVVYEAGMNAIPHPVFLLDNENIILFMNRSAKSLLGVDASLITSADGKHRLTHPKILERLKSDTSQQMRDSTLLFADGSSYDLEIYSLNTAETGEENAGKLVFLVNKNWLSQINQQRTEFVSNISHDLQAPIKMIKGHLKLLERMGNLNKEQQTYVKSIEDYTESMNRLVNKVLTLEKLDDIEAINYTRFDFQQKTDDVIKLLLPSAQQKKISLEQDYTKMPTPFISADATLIQQALYNLIDNAIKYSPMKSNVRVIAEKEASTLRVIVEDDGSGIAPIDQPLLFERFFHLNGEEGFENNVQGLGLAIVKSIAEKHGGSVRVESQLGEGSRFYFEIPVHKLN